MSRKLPGSAIVPGTITVTQITGGLNDTTNASYAQANTARTTANDAYGQANTAYGQANAAYGQANNAYSSANLAYSQANNAYSSANLAYDQANASYNVANTKLASAGGTLSGDLIITGNLTVSGNSTTLNTEILTVEDAEIVLLSNVASTPALNAGVVVNRGTSANTFLRWDEALDEWGWSDSGNTTYYFEDLRAGLSTTNTTFGTINTSLGTINTSYQAAYAQANAGYAQANAAYGAANNRVLKAGDTMTGQLNISAGGLLVTGNVGIGTANPAYPFDLLSSTAGYIANFKSSGNYGGVLADAGAEGSAGGGYFAVAKNGSRSGLIGVTGAWIGDSTTDLAISSETGKSIRFYTNGSATPSAIITGGSVAIGTTSPQATFDVRGNIFAGNNGADGFIKLRGYNNANSSISTNSGVSGNYNGLALNSNENNNNSLSNWIVDIGGIDNIGRSGTSDTFNIARKPSGGSTSTLFLINSSGNIGIGTTSPQGKQHNYISSRSTAFSASDGTTWHDLIIQNPNNTLSAAVGIAFELNSSYHSNAGTGIAAVKSTASSDYGADMVFVTRPQNAVAAERARITSGGDFCVGSTEPGNAGTRNISIGNPGTTVGGLQLWSTTSGTHYVQFGDSAAGGAPYSGAVGYNHTDNYLMFWTNQSEKLRLDSTGHLTPNGDNSQNLGSTSKRWANIYTADLNMSNKGSQNDIDGTWGEWTIQEGEENLYVINRRNGKKFKIKLEEV